MEKITLTVKGMTCMGCVASVKNVVGAIPGVTDIEISLENGKVAIAYDPSQAKEDQFRNAINDAGYEVLK